MFQRKKSKLRTRKTKKSKLSQVNPTIFIFTLISILFIGSFISEIYNNRMNVEKGKYNPNLAKLLQKNSYERETGHRIKLNVENGCGQKNIAFMYKNFLREEGFDVMDTKNAKSFDYELSEILLHQEDMQMAYSLSQLMGINDSLIKIDISNDLILDLTLIIGKDFNQLTSYDNASVHYPIY